MDNGWHRSGDKPLSVPMMVSLLTHICVTRSQWVNTWYNWLTSANQPCSLVITVTVNHVSRAWRTQVVPCNTLCDHKLKCLMGLTHWGRDIFKWIFLNENVWISTNISLNFVPKGLINNIPALVQIMAWCRPGNNPSSEPMMANLLTHICVTRPQWVKKQSSSITSELISPWSTWTPFHRWIFQRYFLEWNVLYFDSNFTELCS